MPTLGEIIKAYREEHDMSMAEFSKRSGISKAYISVLEKNKRPGSNSPVQPSMKCILQASEAMKIDFVELLAVINDINIDDIENNENPKSYDYVADEDKDILKYVIDHNIMPEKLPEKSNALNVFLNELKYNITLSNNSYGLLFDNQYGSGSVQITQKDIDWMFNECKKYMKIIADNLLYKSLIEGLKNTNIYIEYPKPNKLPEIDGD